MNGHVIATTLGQITGAIIGLFFILGILFITFRVFGTFFMIVWVIISFPLKLIFFIGKLLLAPFHRDKKGRTEASYQAEKQPKIQQGVIDTPEYIGLLTKIDKKQIAEDYLREQRRGKHGRKK